MNKRIKLLPVFLLVGVIVVSVSCGSDTKNIDEDKQNSSSVVEKNASNVVEDDSTIDLKETFENDFIKFEIPNDWFVGEKNENSVSIYPADIENIGVTGVSFQLVDTEGYVGAMKYSNLTASTVSSVFQDVLYGKNGLMFFEVRGIVSGGEFQSYLWQLVADVDDENVLLISLVSDVPETSFNVQSLVDSVVVK